MEEGDFTLVFGFPGRTNEYLPSYAVDQIVTSLNPAKKLRSEKNRLKIMDTYMRKDEKIKIKYAAKCQHC